MPELPEVEAVCRKIQAEALGQKIVRAAVFRAGIVRPQSTDEVEAAITGRTIQCVERRAKNILLYLSGGTVVRIHLRMTGNLYVVLDVRLRSASVRAYFEFRGHRGLVFDDPRALGRLHVHTKDEIDQFAATLGPEPLSPEFTLDWLAVAARASRKPAKLFLMDQSTISGLGNIYAAEALFRARVHPAKPMNRLRRPKLKALHEAIVTVLADAVQSACITYSGPGNFGEAESFPCFVYDREGEACSICRRLVRRMSQGGRSTYYCPGCQK